MQAWAGFAQAAAIAFAAIKAADVFAVWRRQRIEERRLHHAEQALTLVYRLQAALEHIRAPMHLPHELSSARQKLENNYEGFNLLPANKQSSLDTTQVILDRITYHKDDWNKLNEIIPVCSAFFGQDVKEQLDIFWRKRNSVQIHAEAYGRGMGPDEAFQKKVMAHIWLGYSEGSDEADPVKVEIEQAVSKLEAALLPILRDEGALSS